MSNGLASLALAALLVPATLYFLIEANSHFHNDAAKSSFRLFAVLAVVSAFAQYRLLSAFAFARRAASQGCAAAVSWPVKDRLLGLDYFLSTLRAIRAGRFQESLAQRFRDLGANTYWANSLGQDVIFTCEPDNVKAILATRFDDWAIAGPRLYAVLPVLGPNSIFTSNGPSWHASRAMLRPSFVRDQVADLACFDHHVGNLLARIPRDGRAFDMQELLNCMSMDSSTDFLLGFSSDTLRNPDPKAKAFVEAFESTSKLSAQRALLGSAATFVPSRTLNAAVKTSQEFVSFYMDRALAEMKEKTDDRARSYVFFDEMVKSGATKEYMRDQIMSIIIAGRDTTAHSITACFFFMSRNQEAWKKARKEVVAMDTKDPTWDQLKEMKYLNWVVKEALRLLPPVAGNSRQTTKETILPKGGGPDGQSPVLLPKGTPCRFSSYTMHRRKDIYGADAEEFRPERWEHLRPGWDYVPFSGGPRICIGQQFALTQVLFTLFRVMQNFKDIKGLNKPGEPTLRVSSTIAFMDGCLLSLTPA